MPDYSFSDDLRKHWGVFLGVMIAMIIWCGVDVQPRGQVVPGNPDLHKSDFSVYTEAGAAFFDGRDPYRVTNIRGWPYVYPPLFALLMSPLHSFTPTTQVAVFFFFCVGLAFGCYAECRLLVAAAWNRSQQSGCSQKIRLFTNELPKIPQWLFPIAFAAVTLPALNSLQRGQVGILKLYPLLLGFRLILLGRTKREWLLGGIAIAFPVALKLTPLLPASCILFLALLAAISQTNWSGQGWSTGKLWWAWLQRFVSLSPRPSGDNEWRPFAWGTGGAVLGCALFFLLIPAVIIGWDANLGHLNMFYNKVIARADDVREDDFGGEVDSPRNQSLFNASYLFAIWLTADPNELEKARRRNPLEVVERQALPDFPVVNRLVPIVSGLALLALLIAAVCLGCEANLTGQGAVFGLACVASLIVSPVARGHYFVLLLPALLFVPLWLLERERPRRALCMALIPAVICFIHYTMLSTAGRMGVMGIAITLWFFTACGMMMRIKSSTQEAVASSDKDRNQWRPMSIAA